jgi:hypothetical protein
MVSVTNEKQHIKCINARLEIMGKTIFLSGTVTELKFL